MNQNDKLAQTRSAGISEDSGSESSYPSFRDEMLYLEAHPDQISRLANNSPSGRLRFLAELFLWIELGRPDLKEWQERFCHDVAQARFEELLQNDLAESYFSRLISLNRANECGTIIFNEKNPAQNAQEKIHCTQAGFGS